MYDIRDKIAVVTGSGRGIGRELGLGLAKQGAKVVVNVKKRIDDGNETLKLIKEYSDGIMVQADVSTRDGCKKLTYETEKAFGKCHILVNNAGLGIAMPFMSSDDKLINKMFSTNLMSCIYCTQEFNTVMEDGGSIIMMASFAGIKPMAMLSMYGITKAAVLKMTEYLALELSPRHIRVNAIAPSVIKTKMGESLLDFAELTEEEYAKNYTLTGKIITPEEIFHAVHFLIKSENITGQTLVIDSGQRIMGPAFANSK